MINVFNKINEINTPKIILLLQWLSPDRHNTVEVLYNAKTKTLMY